MRGTSASQPRDMSAREPQVSRDPVFGSMDGQQALSGVSGSGSDVQVKDWIPGQAGNDNDSGSGVSGSGSGVQVKDWIPGQAGNDNGAVSGVSGLESDV